MAYESEMLKSHLDDSEWDEAIVNKDHLDDLEVSNMRRMTETMNTEAQGEGLSEARTRNLPFRPTRLPEVQSRPFSAKLSEDAGLPSSREAAEFMRRKRRWSPGRNLAGIGRDIRGGLALPADEAEPAEMSHVIEDQDVKTDSTEVYIFEYEDPDELMNLNQDQYIEVKVTLDSGAVDHVANSNDLPGYTATINPKAKNFVGANGDVIANMGEVEVIMEAPDTGTEIGSTFQLAKVTRALYSVSKMDDGGAEIRIKGGKASVFKGNQHITTFTREGGL
jgi:hypothetical protein